jgi:hypothetical protein
MFREMLWYKSYDYKCILCKKKIVLHKTDQRLRWHVQEGLCNKFHKTTKNTQHVFIFSNESENLLSIFHVQLTIDMASASRR